MFNPPINKPATGDAITLNGKTEDELSVANSSQLNNKDEDELSVDNAAKLDGVDADEYLSSTTLPIPDTTYEKQVLYRTPFENKLSNPSFTVDLTGWADSVFGALTTATIARDTVDFRSSPAACNISFDTTGLEGEMGVMLTVTGVDLTGVEAIEFYAKQLSASTYYTDVSISNFTIGTTFIGMQVTGKTGGSSGCIDNEWRRCYTEPDAIPVELRTTNQTLHFYFTTQWAKAIEFVVDDFAVYGPTAVPFDFIDIDEYIGEQVDVHLDIPDPEEYKQIMYRTIKVNAIPSGDMERSDVTPWYYSTYSNEVASMDSSIYHSGSKSLKLTFDLIYSIYLMLDGIDLTGVDEITFWMYGGANCANGTVGASLGEMPSAQSFSTGSWTQITYEVPSGNKTTGQNLSLEITCTANTGIAIYLDDVVALVNPSDKYGWMSLPVSWAGALASDPSTPDNGAMYWNTTGSTLKIYVNSVVGWKTITTT